MLYIDTKDIHNLHVCVNLAPNKPERLDSFGQ